MKCDHHFDSPQVRQGDSDEPQYHPNYYGAFVLDPDGHNMEAVSDDPE